MLLPRIIPCLLVKNHGLVKTVRFADPKYVGDPINAVKIFNEKAVDELIVLDIDATVEGRGPDYRMIEKLATECRMPLCYGGGVKTIDQVEKIVSLGVEKVSISSGAVSDRALVEKAAEIVGSQSVVVVMDVKRGDSGDGYEVWTHNGMRSTGIRAVDFARQVEELGAGEVVINSIDQDGVMRGYDLQLVSQIRNAVHVPITAIGGAGSLDDMGVLIRTFGAIGVGAGSLFVFKGKYKAVLISYPSPSEKDALLEANYECFMDSEKSFGENAGLEMIPCQVEQSISCWKGSETAGQSITKKETNGSILRRLSGLLRLTH